VRQVTLAETESDVRACWPVMAQLRGQLDVAAFVRAVERQRAEGYRLAFIREGDAVRCVAGFRIGHNLAWGRFLYIDDLVTDQAARSEGYGGELFDWCVDFARREGCDQLHLDSGVQRFDAHRFYLHKRMRISSHHFALALTHLRHHPEKTFVISGG
jgi:GNAT superfamily N-acetyltransferase